MSTRSKWLAEALIEYQGTVIFTSHDRHFTKRVATCIVEVRDSRVTSYGGNYDAYVYNVNKEIEAGEREPGIDARGKLPPAVTQAKWVCPGRDEKKVRKEIKTVEQTIARLDEQKRTLNAQLLESTDATEGVAVAQRGRGGVRAPRIDGKPRNAGSNCKRSSTQQ